MQILGGTINGGIVIDTAILYTFSTFTFTNANAMGNTGPTLSNALSSYSNVGNTWINNTSFFNVVNGIQYWTVPTSGTYTITAAGASGGGNLAGNGAVITGSFNLTKGSIIRILVGQVGQFSTWGSAGGGTFVVQSPYNTNSSILAIAGGGGGQGASQVGRYSYADGQTTANAITNSGVGISGGVNGGGGGASGQTGGNATVSGGNQSGSTWSGGGGGFFTNGGRYNSNTTAGGSSFISGGIGGASAATGSNKTGGFGGGAGGGDRGTGGGGYSGGGASSTTSIPGGGGGSYNSGANRINTAGINVGNGYVIISSV